MRLASGLLAIVAGAAVIAHHGHLAALLGLIRHALRVLS